MAGQLSSDSKQGIVGTLAQQDDDTDFLISFPTTESGILDAAVALNYLPANYKLVCTIPASDEKGYFKALKSYLTDASLEDRVVMHEEAGTSGTEAPIYFYGTTDAVINPPYGNGLEPDSVEAMTMGRPITLSQLSDDPIEYSEPHGRIRVAAGNPEALATAILDVAYDRA